MSGNAFTSDISRHVWEVKYRYREGGRVLLSRPGARESGLAVDFDSQCPPWVSAPEAAGALARNGHLRVKSPTFPVGTS